MKHLVDGYNLLFAAGFGRPESTEDGHLHRARLTMLNYLTKYLLPQEAHDATVVFDAKDAPKHLQSEFEHGGIRVIFARDHNEADDLIEERIRSENAPHQLVVVTDDLRLQVVAQRRRTQLIKCHDWLDSLERRHRDQRQAQAADEAAQESQDPRRAKLTPAEVDEWLNEFEIEPRKKTDGQS